MAREPIRKPQLVRGGNFFHAHELDAIHFLFFREKILPTGREQFADGDVTPAIYFDDREWVEHVVFGRPGDRFRHEGYLDTLFWRESGPPILVVLGGVGTGKSTLVEYYLRCYCPKQRPDEFRKKLIVWVDAKGFDPLVVRAQFFQAVKSAIEDAMARTGRTFRLGQPTANVDDWVMAALKEITRPTAAREAAFEYVVLVIDNLEQASVHAQERILRVVEEWRSIVQIKLWRIIIPLWKSTYVSLQNNRHALLQNARPFEIGPVHRQRHLDRFALCRDALQGAADIPADVRARCGEFLDFWQAALQPHIDWIEQLCEGDLRRQFRILGDFIKSSYIYALWANQTGGRVSEYETKFALVCGKSDALVHDLTRIGNVLALGAGRERPRDMLIGWHLLHVVRQTEGGETDPKRLMAGRLGRLGYAVANIRRALDNLLVLNAYHQDLDSHDRSEVVPHTRMIDAYIDLASDPAYVDAIAPVTPVEPARRDALLWRLVGVADAFVAKTETTLEFIRFVRDNEREFLDIRHTRPDLDPAHFDEALRGLPLPYLWVPMALNYARRLEGLRRSGTLPGISAETWDQWLKSDVLTAAVDHPKVMAPQPGGGGPPAAPTER